MARCAAAGPLQPCTRLARPAMLWLLPRLTMQAHSPHPALDPTCPSPQALLSHLRCPCTVRRALTRCLDLTGAPRKSLLRQLAEHCSDEAERRTLTFFTARAGREAYRAHCADGCPSLLDLLARFPSCSPPLEVLLDALPPLAPRQYSLTTSPLDSPHRLQVALSVVQVQTMYGAKHGVATGWLERMCAPLLAGGGAEGQQQPAVRVPIYMRDGGAFKPPSSTDKPWIMVGPGTGGPRGWGCLACLARAVPPAR